MSFPLKKLADPAYLEILTRAPQIMTWVGDAHFNNIYVSPSLSEFAGVSLEEALGQGFRKAIHPDDLKIFSPSAHYPSFGPNYRPFRTEYRARRWDGEYRWMMDLIVPLFGTKNEFQGCFGLVVDIHEEKISAPEELGFSVKNTGINHLSERELQVLKFVGQGASARHIAQELSLSIKTVNTYLERIKKKLNFDNLNKLVRFATLWAVNPLFPLLVHEAKIYSNKEPTLVPINSSFPKTPLKTKNL